MKQLLIALICFFSFSAVHAQDYTVTMKVAPKEALSERWVFLVDGSDSISTVLPKAMAGFRETVNYTGESLKWTCILFSEEWPRVYYGENAVKFFVPHNHDEFNWFIASKKNFGNLQRWIGKNITTNSKVHLALKTALTIDVKNITIIFITDGGITEACHDHSVQLFVNGNRIIERDTRFDETNELINTWQEWRKKRGLNYALISCIGISNGHYSWMCKACSQKLRTGKSTIKHNYGIDDNCDDNIGGKPSDKKCQAWLSSLGSQWHGGYWLVEKK